MPGYVRLMAGQVLSAKENEYVVAARSIGAGHIAVMFRHILPNCLSPLIVQVTLVIGLAILIEATLSFLGLGIKPPTAAWGSMVYDGYRYLALRPILSIGPAWRSCSSSSPSTWSATACASARPAAAQLALVPMITTSSMAESRVRALRPTSPSVSSRCARRPATASTASS